jgi:hypothetical protein
MNNAPIMDQKELIAFLDRGEFDALIGAVETGEIDFKRSPYRLDEPPQAFELAKDVSALANAPAGGILVVGFQTRAFEESGLDTVETVHPFPRTMFDRERWVGKVYQLVYPTVVGLDAIFKPSQADGDQGVAVVVVPAQSPDARYFVVAKEFASEDGAPGWMLGISVRSADRNRPLGLQEIHGLLSRSLNIGSDLNEIKALVRDFQMGNLDPTERVAAPTDALDLRVQRALDATGED